MTILFLGPDTSPLLRWLRQQEASVIQTDQKITSQYAAANDVTFIVSYGYRSKITKEILDAVSGRAVNLHISYLPWNRGADPNFWSFVEDTPKGVTIHYVDEGFDTGDIIVQKPVEFNIEAETLATSYQKLHDEIQTLFKNYWHLIKSGKCDRQKQPVEGTLHRSRDKEPLTHLLTEGWNTSVSVLCEYAAEMPMSGQFRDKYDLEIMQMRDAAKGVLREELSDKFLPNTVENANDK
jgi:methionyl-tRNA formyltransferase